MAGIRSILTSDRQIWPFVDAQSENDVSLLYTVSPHDARPPGEDAFEYAAGDGPRDVNWKYGSQTLSADARHIEYTGASHLCNACLSALGYLTKNLQDCIEHEGDSEFRTKKSVVHHQNLMALFAAANEGCQLCKTIWGRKFKTNGMATAPDIRTEFCWNTTDKTSWDGTLSGDARLLCNIVSTTAQNHNKHTWDAIFRFQLWPSLAFDDYFKANEQGPLSLLGRGNTRSSRSMAV
ncbi:MAG: hypothetical protein Q9195_000169 [Heterodermia aff. obscurata]